MTRKEDILKIFDLFNKQGIRYFVLRDFSSIERIVRSKDIDIFIEKKDLKNAERILKKNEWTRRKINNNKFPHIQFFKMFTDGIAMFDIVDKFCFGSKNLLYTPENKFINYNRKLEKICICDESLAISTFVYHILYDKNILSEKNRIVLTSVIKDYKTSEKFVQENVFYLIAEKLLVDSSPEKISEYKKIISIKNPLYQTFYLSTVITVKKRILDLIFRICKHVSNKSICFIGLDGSGKSSTINALSEIYGNKAVVVYMGMKEFKSKSVEKLVYTKRNSNLNKIKKMIYLYIEMIRRYFQYRYTGKVIIFDRYVDDIYLGGKGITNLTYKILFKYLFPKPKIKFYMYCSVETSLCRKDDIEDQHVFTLVKERYDNEYLNSKSINCISTDKNNQEQTIRIVIDVLNKMLKEGIF